MLLAKVIPVNKSDDIKNCKLLSAYFDFTIHLKNDWKSSLKQKYWFLLTKHNLLNDKPNGFHQKHSTYMALLETVDHILEAEDKKDATVRIFFDLSKAFDTVNHKILLNKTEYY